MACSPVNYLNYILNTENFKVIPCNIDNAFVVILDNNNINVPNIEKIQNCPITRTFQNHIFQNFNNPIIINNKSNFRTIDQKPNINVFDNIYFSSRSPSPVLVSPMSTSVAQLSTSVDIEYDEWMII